MPDTAAAGAAGDDANLLDAGDIAAAAAKPGDGKGGDAKPGDAKPDGSGASRIIEHNGAKIEVPADLWDAAANDGKGGVDAAKAVKLGLDLQARLGLGAREVKFDLPDDLKGKFEVDPESPLFKTVADVLKDEGVVLPPAALNKLAEAYARDKLGLTEINLEAEAERVKADNAALRQVLGANAAPRVKEAKEWAVGMLQAAPEAQRAAMAEELSAICSSAAGIQLLVHLQGQFGARGAPVGGGAPAADLTEADLAALQNDPRYYRDKDPDIIRKVTEGYKRLYPSG